MYKKIICSVIILAMSISILCGCGNKGIWFNIGFNGAEGIGFKETNQGLRIFNDVAIVHSFDEKKALLDEWNNQAYQENSEYFASELSKKIREYDAAYFNENSLIFYSFERGYAVSTLIKSISVNQTQLIINTCHVKHEGTFTDEAFTWLFLIEVKKADILECETVQINLR